ncbi:MAG: magnesium transporter [Flavobacteriales bacterium]|nr:magnesium transporter [Flavobacteriales bacterium]MCX7767523.1 magnesium transporter [Flavobacteriales bacterium]MDW8409658.1 magnesium transporter [Flavobacteriales bacterium]
MKPEELKKLTEEFSQIDRIIEMVPALRKMPVVEVGEILQALQDEHVFFVLEHFPLREQGLLFAEFPMARQLDFFRTISRKRFAEVFEHMPSDIRVDFFQHLTQDEQAALLPYLSKKVREDVIHLSAYPPDTAGGIMSTDFATVRRDMTCAEAILKVRKDAPSKKTIYYIYVVDDNQIMLGFITLKDLIMASPDSFVADVLHTDFVYVTGEDPREKVAQMIEKYDLVAIPVLNKESQLVGIVTHEEALEVIQAEHTEEMQKFMGIMEASERFDYLGLSSFSHFRKRVVWLVYLAAIGIISGLIIHHYEAALQKLLILALYMPMVADTGGNAESQSATVVVRALALGQITPRHGLHILWKETCISSFLAICLGLLVFGNVLFLSWETEIPSQFSLGEIALTISLALSLQVVSATIIGAALPLLVKRFGGDPAVAASPAITTIVDITGLLIYFTLANTLLDII